MSLLVPRIFKKTEKTFDIRVVLEPREINEITDLKEYMKERLERQIVGKVERYGLVEKIIQIEKISKGIINMDALNGSVTYNVWTTMESTLPERGDILMLHVSIVNEYGMYLSNEDKSIVCFVVASPETDKIRDNISVNDEVPVIVLENKILLGKKQVFCTGKIFLTFSIPDTMRKVSIVHDAHIDVDTLKGGDGTDDGESIGGGKGKEKEKENNYELYALFRDIDAKLIMKDTLHILGVTNNAKIKSMTDYKDFLSGTEDTVKILIVDTLDINEILKYLHTNTTVYFPRCVSLLNKGPFVVVMKGKLLTKKDSSETDIIVREDIIVRLKEYIEYFKNIRENLSIINDNLIVNNKIKELRKEVQTKAREVFLSAVKSS